MYEIDISIVTLLVVLTAHFIGDFMLQSHWIASNKSSNNTALGIHIVIYAVTLYAFTGSIAFALVNGILHLVTDYFTSRWTSKLWKDGDIHNFFVVIGLDQLIHSGTLIISIMLLGTGIWAS